MDLFFFRSHKHHQLAASSFPQLQTSTTNSSNAPLVYTTSPPYTDHQSYLQMLGAYLTPSGSGYKCVDPYFLSQGENY